MQRHEGKYLSHACCGSQGGYKHVVRGTMQKRRPSRDFSPPRNRPASLNCGDEQRVGHEQLPRSGRGSGEAAKFSTGHSGRPGTTLIYLALRLMSRERKPAGSPTSHFLDWHRRARINPRPVRLGTAQSSWLRRSGTSLYLMRLHFPTHPVDDGSRSLTSRQGRRQAAAKTRLHKDLHIKWF